MLDSIRTVSDVPAGALLVRHCDRLADRQRQRLLAQARGHASRLVAEATEQADQIRLQAMREGYNNGVLQAAAQVAQAFLLEQGMASRLRTDVIECLRSLLNEALGNEAWLQGLVQRWLDDVCAQPAGSLQILLPASHSATPALRRALQERWPEGLNVELHAEQRFVFRQGAHVLEFDPPAITEPLAPRLAAQLDALRPALGAMDQACAEYLQTWVDGVVAGSRAQHGGLSDAD